MLPSVDTTVQDGGIGVVRPSAKFIAVVGCSTSGPLNMPTSVNDITTLTSTFGDGSAVQSAALVLRGGSPVLFTRALADADGEHGTLDDSTSEDSTSIVTIDSALKPNDDARVAVRIVTGGTIGTAGIVFQTSVDAGGTWSAPTKLGTANTLTVAGRLKLNFATGTLTAGDSFAVVTVAPSASGSSLADAFDALSKSSIAVRRMVIASSPVTAAIGGAVDTFCLAQAVKNKPLRWMGSTRMLDATDSSDVETPAEYFTEMEALSEAYSTKFGNIYARECYQVSAITGKEERRPAMFAAIGRQSAVEENIDIADLNLGALVGTRVRGLDGNPDPQVYDSEIYGGDLDDLGFATLRSWSGVASGTYVTNPRLFAPYGTTDFTYMHRGLVMDLAHVTAAQDLAYQLSTNVQINKDGTIAENQAKRIEDRLTQKLKSVLLIPDDPAFATGKASGVTVVVDRTNNVASTERVRTKVRILPNGTLKHIDLDIGYEVTSTIQAAA